MIFANGRCGRISRRVNSLRLGSYLLVCRRMSLFSSDRHALTLLRIWSLRSPRLGQRTPWRATRKRPYLDRTTTTSKRDFATSERKTRRKHAEPGALAGRDVL